MIKFSQSAATCLGLSAAFAVWAMGGAAHADNKVQDLPADAPGPQTARIIDRPPTPSDILVLGSVIKDTHAIVAGGRGSVAVGLLFGPLGVAANAAHADAVNQGRAKAVDGLIHTDTLAVLASVRQPADGSPAPVVAADARAYELIPVIQLTFVDDKTFQMGCVLSASLANPGKRAWHTRYAVHLDGVFDSGDPVSLDAAAKGVTACFAEANRLFGRYARGEVKPSDAATPVEIAGKVVKMRLDDAEYPAHVVVPDYWGVTEWPGTSVVALGGK